MQINQTDEELRISVCLWTTRWP